MAQVSECYAYRIVNSVAGNKAGMDDTGRHKVMRNLQVLAHLIGFFGITASCMASELCPDMSRSSPARLLQSEEQKELAENLISVGGPDNTILLFSAEGKVNIHGDFVDICCNTSNKRITASYSKGVMRKLRRIKFVPAKIDAQDVEVYLGITIIAVKTPDGTKSKLVLNRLNSVDKFGYEYTAPQRLGEFEWPSPSGVRNSLTIYNGVRTKSNVHGRLAVDVDEFGNASNAHALDWRDGLKMTELALGENLENNCYVPGHVEGRAVAMPYTEVFIAR